MMNARKSLMVGDRVVVVYPPEFAGSHGEIVARWWTQDRFDVQLDEASQGQALTFDPEMLRPERP